MKKVFISCGSTATAITLAVIAFVPEDLYISIKPNGFSLCDNGWFIVLCRALILCTFLGLCLGTQLLYRVFRQKITIRGKNYLIIVKYQDLFESKDEKKVINFDECFSTKVGEAPGDIKPNSVCGQYLSKVQNLDVQRLISESGLKPEKRKSEYQNGNCYKAGSIIPNGDFLLMAFARLDKNGLGEMTYDEYSKCLNILWSELDKYHGSKSVCVPILGAGCTRFDGTQPTQQELLDIMIGSYKLSRKKLKLPYRLIIVCKKKNDFSLNKIGQML